jgi:hypothetical protein
MDWPLVIVGVFAASAILLLQGAIRNPERWRARNVSRWARASGLTILGTAAVLAGAALAGAAGKTLGIVAVIGLVAFSLAARLLGLALLNGILDRWRR